MLKFVAVIAGAIVVLAGLLYLMQRSIIFPAPPGELLNVLPDGVEHVPLVEGHAFLMKPLSGEAPAPLLVYAQA